MDRRTFYRFGLGMMAALTPVRGEAAAADAEQPSDPGHRVAIQVISGDPKTQALGLANTRNFATFYRDRGEAFAIQIVAFGPGYGMLQDDVSEVKAAIASLMRDLGSSVSFVACQSTRKAIAKSRGVSPEQIAQVQGIKDTASGVVHLAELQRQGWSYIRP